MRALVRLNRPDRRGERLEPVNHTGMELGSLRREPHDLVALELAMVLMSVDSFALQGLDQARF
jgi:hypothetical protein